MNPTRVWRAAVAVCALTVVLAGPLRACVLCEALGCPAHPSGDHNHALPEPSQVAAGVGLYSYDAPVPQGGRPTSTVPVFNSRPGAHAKLFLDFDGVDFGTLSWSGKLPGLRPAYDIDGDISTFGTEEQRRIEQIWSRVAEAYSMFNINVTTEDPGNYNRRESAHIVISGNNEWYGGGGGVAYVGGFSSSASAQTRRTGWVFPGNLRSGDAKVVADAAIHEAGHLFGLQHQSTYNDSGTRTDPYDSNFSSILSAPNLGVAYNARRGLWAIGANSNNANSTVDEITTIARSTNGFGYAPDEPGTGFANAELFRPSADPLRGVIRDNNDADFYRFEVTEPSEVSLLVDVAQYGPNLDARLALYDSDQMLLFEDDPTLSTSRESLTASFAGVLEAGVYFLEVASHGGFTYDNGPRDRTLVDAGQYFLSGLVAAVVPEPGAVALLALLGYAAAPHLGRGGRRR